MLNLILHCGFKSVGLDLVLGTDLKETYYVFVPFIESVLLCANNFGKTVSNFCTFKIPVHVIFFPHSLDRT